MSYQVDLARLRQNYLATLGATPGSFEEDAVLRTIDAYRDEELAARDRDRARRNWQRKVAKSVRERRA